MCLLSLPKLKLPTNTFSTQCYESVQINMGSSKTMTVYENTSSFTIQSPKIFVSFSRNREMCVIWALQHKKNDNITWIKFSRKMSCNLQRWALIVLYHSLSVIPLGLSILCFLWFNVNEESKCLSESKWSILTTISVIKHVLQSAF